jgi:hypothetical protein
MQNSRVPLFFQVHLEQGPVLEALRYPLGVVKGIAGQTRLKVHCSSTTFCDKVNTGKELCRPN